MIEAAEASGGSSPAARSSSRPPATPASGWRSSPSSKGYRCVFVCPDKVSEDKQQRAQGVRRRGRRLPDGRRARAPATPTTRSPTGWYARSTARWKPDQYSNPEGPASHYATTGPEIWARHRRPGHPLRRRRRHRRHDQRHRPLPQGASRGRAGPVQVIGADPEGSVYSGGTGRPYLVEGVGEDFWPTAYDPAVPDEIVAVCDADSFAMTRRLAREEGLLVGGSCGMAVVAALEVAERPGPGRRRRRAAARRRPRLPVEDLQRRRGWRRYGFLRAGAEHDRRRRPARARPATCPRSCTPTRARPCATPIEILREYGVSQMPVVKAEPPVMAGEVAGSVSERDLLDAAVHRQGAPRRPRSSSTWRRRCRWSAPASRSRPRGTRSRTPTRSWSSSDGKPAGVLTRADLLGFLAE